jgi:CheY-like chemotaxis protein
VFGFVRQSGGHVKIYSEVGHGTSVKVYLPRHYGTAQPDLPEPRGGLPKGSQLETILVVEDDESVRAFSAESLRELGYRVLEAGSGAAALEMLKGGEPALLFTDVVMPGLSGPDLARQATAILPTLKVLFTTGYTRNAIVHNGVLDAGTQLLQKPFSIEQLAAKVRSVLDG